MAFELPALPYGYDDLAPNIGGDTMRVHHDKHHAGYTNNLNAAIEKHPELAGVSAEDLLRNLESMPEDIRTAVRNNGGGYVNHSLFWEVMSPNGGGNPGGGLAAAIDAAFGSVDELKIQIQRCGRQSFRFGLGMARRRRIWQPGGLQHRQPGQPLHAQPHPYPGAGCVGACLLPELPEPPRRLRQGFLEHCQLGRGGS